MLTGWQIGDLAGVTQGDVNRQGGGSPQVPDTHSVPRSPTSSPSRAAEAKLPRMRTRIVAVTRLSISSGRDGDTTDPGAHLTGGLTEQERAQVAANAARPA